ncbi:AAA family ATPase [Dactylosporangium sp. AC04546]|uniref:AAA family ATPase n=1 Tax=Dactylosporangium sp. AC04546 TaxID=2862460 RepID=UPI002E7BC139|nr:AAA family ATPase [Dactylosporangium sp. AC04546]WVK86169.1 AAA family ATPase [Dactylosporangium sp. AC04546]
MRIGIAGTHGVGKSTLVEELVARHPDHVGVDEPFVLLEERGYEFDHPPSAADYLVQLKASLRLLRQPGRNVVFDRTPLDFVAYLRAVGADVEVDGLAEALASLEMVVVLPITGETERVLPEAEFPGLRQDVNDALLELVHDCEVTVVELDCPLDRRVEEVSAAITRVRPPASPRPGTA